MSVTDPIDPAIWATNQSRQSTSNPLWAGIKSGVVGLGADLAGTYGAVGRGLGIQSLGDAGTNVANYLGQKAQEVGRPDLEVAPWQEGGAHVLPWLAYQGAKLVPTLAGLAAAPELAVEKVGVTAAKSLGMGAVALPFAPGQVYNAAGEKPGGATQSDALKALALSPVTAALNTFAPGLLVGGIGGHIIGDIAGKIAAKGVGGFMARAGAGALVDGAAGAIQAGASTALVQEAVRPDLTPQEKIRNIVDATATGGALGAAAGGVLSGFRGDPVTARARELSRTPTADITPDHLNEFIDAATQPPPAAPPAAEAPPVTAEAPPAPSPFAHVDDATLQQKYGETYDYLSQHLEDKDPSQYTPEEQQLVAAHAEIADEIARRKSNGSVTTYDVQPDAVGAVEQQSDASGGVEPNLTVAPAPAAFDLDATLKGISTKKSYSDATSEEDLRARLTKRLEDGSTAKGDMVLAERLGLDLSKPAEEAPTATNETAAPVEAAKPAGPDDLLKGVGEMPKTDEVAPTTAREPTPEPERTANQRGGDQTLDTDFRADLRKIIAPESGDAGMKGGLIKQLVQADPRNLEDAQHVVMHLLSDGNTAVLDGSTHENPLSKKEGTRDGYNSLMRLAEKFGLYEDVNPKTENRVPGDEHWKLTDRGVDVARKQIPDGVAEKAAFALGHSDNSDAFTKGARGESSKGLTNDDALAYKAGEQWALDRDSKRSDGAAAPIPRTLEDVKTEQNVREDTAQQDKVGKVERKSVSSGPVRPDAAVLQALNEHIDTNHNDTLRHPDVVAGLKRMVASGELRTKEDVDGAARYLEAGHGALVTPDAPTPIREENRVQTPFGETVVADRMGIERARMRTENRLADAQNSATIPGEAQLRREQDAKLIARHEAIADIKDAHEAGELTDKQAFLAMAKATRGDIEGARAGLPERLRPSRYLFLDGKPMITEGDVSAARWLLSTAATTRDVHEVMQHLADLGGQLGAMAKRFQSLVPDVHVEVKSAAELARIRGDQYDPNSKIQGMFDHGTNTLYLANEMMHPSIALHEITHAIVDKHIASDTSIGKEIKSIFNRFEKFGPKGDYAFTSPYEFMAEFLSREQVRDYIRDAESQGKVGNIFQRTWAAIRKALGGAPQNYVERLLNLAEAAGLNPIGSDGKFISAHQYTENFKDTIENVVDKVQDRFKSLPTAVRTKELYLGGDHTIEELYANKMQRGDRNGLKERNQHNDQRAPTSNLLSRPANEVHDMSRALQRADPKAHDLVKQIMLRVYDGIHPLLPWEAQSKDVRANPLNKPVHAEAVQMMKDLKRRDFANKNTNGVDLYNSIDKVSKVERIRDVADVLHKVVTNTPLTAGKLAGFEQHPVDALLDHSTRDTFGVDNSFKYWNEHIESRLDALRQFVKERQAELDHPGTSDERRAEIMSDIGPLRNVVDNVDKGLTKLAEGPNFHLGHVGDYFVSMKLKLNPDGSVDRQALKAVADHVAEFGAVVPLNTNNDHIFMRVETPAQHQALIAKAVEMQAAGHLRADADTDNGSALVSGKRGDAAAGNIAKDIAPWLASFEASIRNNPEYSKATADQLMTEMRSHMLDQTPDNSMSKFMAPRKSIGGFDEDMIGSFLRRTKAANDAMVGRVVSPKIADSYKEMETRLNEMQRNPKDHAPEDTYALRDVIDELRKRDKIRGEYTQTPIKDALRRIVNFSALGFTVAYPVIQLTQLGMVALPKLGSVHGFVKSASAMGRNSAEAFRITKAIIAEGYDAPGLSKSQRLARAANVEVSLESLKRAGVSGRKAEYLMHLVNSGQLGTGSQAHLLTAAAHGQVDGAFNHTMQLASGMGYYAETLTRVLTGLTHLDLMGPDATPKEAAVGGIKLLKDSLFEFQADAQGRAFGKDGIYGKMTPLMTQFMTYQSQLIQRLYLEAHDAFGKGATPERQAQARTFLMQHAAMTAAFAGTLGLPFATAFAAAYDKLKDLMDPDEGPSDIRSSYRDYLANAVGKDAAEIIAKGGFRALGVDMTSRIGEQDVLPFSKFLADHRAMKDQIKDLESRSWGAPIGLASNAIQGVSKMTDGDFMGGMQMMTPAVISGGVKAYRMMDTGYVDAAGNRLPIDPPQAHDALKQLLGFTPSAKAEYTDASMAQSQRRAQLTGESSALTNRIVQAQDAGDQEGLASAIADAREFDENNATYAVLPRLGSSIGNRVKNRVVSSALHTPLGVKIDDVKGRGLTQYANY